MHFMSVVFEKAQWDITCIPWIAKLFISFRKIIVPFLYPLNDDNVVSSKCKNDVSLFLVPVLCWVTLNQTIFINLLFNINLSFYNAFTFKYESALQ